MQQNENIMLTLNRTEALNKALFDDLVAAVSGMDADLGVGAVVVTGSAKAFAAGADIKEQKSHNPTHPRGAGRVRIRTGRRLQTGHDVLYIIAGDNAKFGHGDQPRRHPGMGGSRRRPTHAVGEAKAVDMVLTGRF